MYNLTGNFWELPELNTGRWSHGCGFYTREEQTVSTQLQGLQRPPIIIRFIRNTAIIVKPIVGYFWLRLKASSMRTVAVNL